MISQKEPTKLCGLVLLSICAFVYVILGGCREREITTVPIAGGPGYVEDYWVRVLLADNVKSCSIRPAGAYTILNRDTNSVIGRFAKSDSTIMITASSGVLVVGNMPVSAAKIEIEPEQPFLVYVNNKGFRGEIQITSNSNGTFDVVNRVPMEAYLAGVVGAEMPPYWDIEALKAQSVACRTYCLYSKQNKGRFRNWDVMGTEASQVYRGITAESPRVWQAVNETAGQTLFSKDEDGKTSLMPAYFSSFCGGRSESSQKVFGVKFESLDGVQCQNCVKVVNKDKFFWPAAEFDKKTVQQRLLAKYPSLAKLGDIAAIMIAERSESYGYSRMVRVRIIGSNGQGETIRAEDLRLTIDPTGHKIKSTACQIGSDGTKFTFFGGRGFGHGVGLCQYGVLAMAREGSKYRDILEFYYPRSVIKKLY